MGDGAKFQPRLCKLSKWAHFNGYGFNLHAERGKAGQYIGKVDEGSPAEAAGLMQGDRIVEVDGMNIGNENHQQVVSRIKAGGGQTSLLVVDSETDKHFKDQRIVVRSEMPEVLVLSSEQPRPAGTDTNEETGENGELNGITSAEIEQSNGRTNEIDLDSDQEEVSVETVNKVEAAPVEAEKTETVPDEPESAIADFTIPPPPTDEPESELNREPSPEPVRDPSPEPVRDPSPEPVRDPSPEPLRDPSPEPLREPSPEPVRAPTPEPVREPTPEPVREPTPEPVREPTPEPVRAPTPEPVKPPTPEPVRTAPEPTPAAQTNGAQANGDPLMRMSAKEMREQLAAKKKSDAKNKKIGFKDKYDIFQRL